MNEPIRCYICKRHGIDLFWINGLSEFMCWHCIVSAVVVLTRETAPSNNGFHADRASGPDNSEHSPETRPAGEP